MKLFLVCLCGLLTATFANVLDFKKTAENGDVTRFELASDEGTMEKRSHIIIPIPSCQSGFVKSKYCTTFAKYCFGKGQLVRVSFRPWFRKPPKVVLGLTLIDTHKDQNVRINVFPVAISTKGFFVKFLPWDLSITYQLGVYWMACP